jgi:hypothetical protein
MDFIEGLFVFLIGIAIVGTPIVIASLIFFDVGLDTGSGEQLGYVSEVEQNGIFWKPTEIRLISIEPTYSESDTVWYYGVLSPELTERSKQSMRSHEKVIVNYETRLAVAKWDYASRTIITDIRSAEE